MAAPSYGDEAESIDKATADFAKAAWQDSLLKLNSGIYEAVGTAQTTRDSTVTESRIVVRSAFDHRLAKVRFERWSSEWESGQTASDFSPDKMAAFINDGHNKLLWSPNSHVASISTLESDLPGYKGMLNPFDVRGLGIIIVTSFDHPADLEKLIKNFWNEKNYQLERVSETEEICTLEWLITKLPGTRRKLILDKTKGYLPISMRWVDVYEGIESYPIENSVEWFADDSGCWVPKAAQMVATTARADGSIAVQHLLTYKIAWESVNEPLDPELFTEAGLHLPHAAAIMDVSVPEGILLRRVGYEGYEEALNGTTEATVVTVKDGGTHRLWLILGNLILGAGLLVMLLFRRTRKPS